MKNLIFQTIIIDDEPDARTVLRELIKRFCPQMAVCGEAASVAEGFESIQQLKPDIVFLDVDLHEGNGFEILDAFPRPDFKVVFVTAHDDFALKAFQYRAFHYLLKPIDPPDLIALANEIGVPVRLSPNEIVSAPIIKNTTSGRLLLVTVQGMAVVEATEIQYIKTDDKYATVVLSTGEKIFASHSLKELEEMLPAAEFLRVHQSWIVRLDAVRRIHKTPGGLTLALKDKTAVPVSRRNKEEVLRVLGMGGLA